MPGAFFVLAVCDQADFSGVAVGGEDGIEAINFSDAYLTFCEFTGSNLNGAIFTDATLISNSIAGAASLVEANFANAYLPLADFTGASLQGCQFDGGVHGRMRAGGGLRPPRRRLPRRRKHAGRRGRRNDVVLHLTARRPMR